MRIFRVLQGKYSGQYKIYDSREEFKKHNPDTPIYYWGEHSNPEQLETGDWIEALDGYILQILHTYKQKSNEEEVKKKKYNYDIKLIVRVAPGTFYILKNSKTGKIRYQKLYAQIANLDSYSLSGESKNFRNDQKTETATLFAQYIVSGYTPIQALMALGIVKGSDQRSKVLHKVMYYLQQPEVITAMQKANTSFLEKIRSEPEFSEENMIQYVKDFMRHVRKGSQVHLQSIPALLSLLGHIEDTSIMTGKKLKDANIREVNYEEVPPPQLGSD